MLNSKYSKVLTIILIIAIIAIIGLLVFVGLDWYKAYTTGADSDDALEQFNSMIENTQINKPIVNGNIDNPNLNLNNELVNEPTGGNSNTNTNGNGGSSSGNKGQKYKGFNVIGKIEIPKIKLEYVVLEEATIPAMEASIGKLYGPGINETGNTVLAGHNYKNGTFFSNNSKLSNGDKIYLTDMQGKKVTYEIYKKYITTPEDFDYAVRDTNGKREVSLTTCTNDTKSRLIIWAKEV